jgi:cyclophilin family peptidyl-prolyl cis-trans isomerase
LNGGHTIFVQVTGGYDVVETIAKTETGAHDKPTDDVVIERIDKPCPGWDSNPHAPRGRRV